MNADHVEIVEALESLAACVNIKEPGVYWNDKDYILIDEQTSKVYEKFESNRETLWEVRDKISEVSWMELTEDEEKKKRETGQDPRDFDPSKTNEVLDYEQKQNLSKAEKLVSSIDHDAEPQGKKPKGSSFKQ
ncbi:hypothetical protein [Burkholderia contaminans]|uniref:hypothetical protein n=1 Tax=Burkholderia contaminans TaxID=488447 RepID=UPI00158A59DA|nr:hypothetical protein [Burkholderia contaminans]